MKFKYLYYILVLLDEKTINWNNYLATKPLPLGTEENKINF